MTEPNTYADMGPLGAGSDAARRISDAYNLHLLADPIGNDGKWMAFRLADGECDPTLYDSKADAIRAKGAFAKNWGFMKLLPTGGSVRECESYLRTCRMVADTPNIRWRNTDADAPDVESIVMTFRREHKTR